MRTRMYAADLQVRLDGKEDASYSSHIASHSFAVHTLTLTQSRVQAVAHRHYLTDGPSVGTGSQYHRLILSCSLKARRISRVTHLWR